MEQQRSVQQPDSEHEPGRWPDPSRKDPKRRTSTEQEQNRPKRDKAPPDRPDDEPNPSGGARLSAGTIRTHRREAGYIAS